MQLIFTLGTSHAFHFRRQFSKKNAKIAILYPSVFLFERGERSSKIESVKFVKGLNEGGFGIKFPQIEQSTHNIFGFTIKFVCTFLRNDLKNGYPFLFSAFFMDIVIYLL